MEQIVNIHIGKLPEGVFLVTSKDVPEGTLRAILREADISPNDFLKKK